MLRLEKRLLEITDNYYREIVNRRDQMLVLGSSAVPMNIVRQIVAVEHLVQEWLNEKKEEPVKKEETDITQYDSFKDELEEMSEELHRMMGGNRK